MAWRQASALAVVIVLATYVPIAVGHPLGNFSTNHYVRIRVSRNAVALHYVVDMAEITTFQEIAAATGGASTSWSERVRDAYLERATARHLEGLRLTIDGARVSLRLLGASLELPEGAGGQPTLRIVNDVAGSFDSLRNGARFIFEDVNHAGRTGWHELVVEASDEVEIFDSSAFADGLSDELRRYPDEVLMAPLQERAAEWSVTTGTLPAGARRQARRLPVPVDTRTPHERLAALLVTPTLTTKGALLGGLLAFALGCLEALAVANRMPPRTTPAAAMLLDLRRTIAELSEIVPVALVALVGAEYLVPAGTRSAVAVASGGLVAVLGLALLSHRTRIIPSFLSRSAAPAVLLAGVAFHHVAYGFVLIGAFGLGLLAARVARDLRCRRESPQLARLAIVARALVIVAAGAAICGNAFGPR